MIGKEKVNNPRCSLCKKIYLYPFYCSDCVDHMCYECIRMCVKINHKCITTIYFTCEMCKKYFTHDMQSINLNVCSSCTFLLL